MRKVLATTLLTGLFCASFQASAGGETSSGNAHTYRQPGRACFTGADRVIKACLVFAEGGKSAFGLDQESIRRDAEFAFNTWAKYVSDYKIQRITKDKGFTTKVDLKADCTGDEDLRIYLGTADSAVKSAIEQNLYKDPWGLMSCEPPNVDGSWNKGLIWIAPAGSIDGRNPNWKDRNKFRAVLLREVGRMYGNGDVDGTIMRTNLSQWLSWDNPPQEIAHLLNQIDWERSLDSQYSPSMTFSWQIENQWRERFVGAFKMLMNREAVGAISETLKVDEGYTYQTVGAIILSDDKGSASFKFTARDLFNPCTPVGEHIFTIGSEQGDRYMYSYTCSQVGEIEGSNGSKIPIAILKDGDGYRYQILIRDASQGWNDLDLFRYSPFTFGYGHW
jgi:hypothetical protein